MVKKTEDKTDVVDTAPFMLQDGPTEVKVEQEFDKDGVLKQPKDVKQPVKASPDDTDEDQHEKAEKAGTSGVQVRNQGGW